VNATSPIASPAKNSGQLKRLGNPPEAMLRKSEMNARTIIAAPATIPAHERLGMPRPPLRSAIDPHTIIVEATNTGAHTGPIQGSGIRKRMSQVEKESGQWIINRKKP